MNQNYPALKTGSPFRNFRDLALHNPLLAPGFIYRSASLSLVEDGKTYNELLKEKQVTTIVDLRADREVVEQPYPPERLEGINYLSIPFDPWKQPDWFARDCQQGNNSEIAYRFFTMVCKPAVKRVMEGIISQQDGALVIHCHAGKDRTGIIAAMLHLLSDAPMETIYRDYLASKMDVRTNYLDVALALMDEAGGIKNYLQSCGLDQDQTQALKKRICHVSC